MDKLFEQIENIQKQPVHIRQRILFVSTGVLSLLVFLFWLSIFPSKLDRMTHATSSRTSSTSPFSALIGTVKEAGKGLSIVGDVIGAQVHYVRQEASTTRRLLEESYASSSPSSAPSSTSSVEKSPQ